MPRFAGLRPVRTTAAAILLAVAGCAAPSQPGTPATSANAGPRTHVTGMQGGSAEDQIFNTDPCAQRLQDIEEALLEYYAINRKLPDSLNDLRKMPDVGATLSFVCPDTGAPYSYNPAGLGSANNAKRIIVFDSVPHADGHRWCILMPPPMPSHPGEMSLEVVSFPETVFRQFVPPD